ncbi:MAG: sensor histidine kinase [Burkholderiales bacterium]|nr:sensor histidine kinase [Burkholderiales bacterium]
MSSLRAALHESASIVSKLSSLTNCRLVWLAAASALLGGLIAMVFGPAALRFHGVEGVVTVVLVIALILLVVFQIGSLQRDSENATHLQRALSKRLRAAHEEERRYLARELHDQLGQLLTSIKLRVEWLAKRSPDPDWNNRLLEAAGLVDQALTQTRQLAIMLSPPEIEALGLPAALASLVANLFADSDALINLDIDSIEPRPDRLIEVTAFRVAQESLTNVVRHANAGNVAVRLKQAPGWLRLHIIDDGIGFDSEETRRPNADGGLGIPGMRERALLAGGALTLQSSRGFGTEIQLSLPLKLPGR